MVKKNTKLKTAQAVAIDTTSTCIPSELMQPGTYYTFTLNPKIQPIQFVHLSQFVDEIKNKVQELGSCEIDIFPELSHSGRWHYHGWIRITDIISFFMEDIPKLQSFCHYEIDTILDYNWAVYVHKNAHLMSKYCTNHHTEYGIHFRQPHKNTDDYTTRNEYVINYGLKEIQK